MLHGVAWCWVSDGVGCCMVLRGVACRMKLGVAWCCVVLTLGKQHSDNRVLRNNTYTLSQGFKARRVFAVFKYVVELCKHPFWGALLRLQHAERASSGFWRKGETKAVGPFGDNSQQPLAQQILIGLLAQHVPHPILHSAFEIRVRV